MSVWFEHLRIPSETQKQMDAYSDYLKEMMQSVAVPSQLYTGAAAYGSGAANMTRLLRQFSITQRMREFNARMSFDYLIPVRSKEELEAGFPDPPRYGPTVGERIIEL